MCGIAGVIGAKKADAEVHRMVDTLRHRGPDGVGFYDNDGCTLGHARLAVVDLATGQQPMHGPGTALVFNGEIFGYRPLREKLAKAYPLKSQSSDTEVILALYAKYGDDFPAHLPGQFAVAVWDERARKLVCARDRFGEKPLYYSFGKNGEFVFASEIKAIIASGLVRPVIDRDSLAHYLKHLYVPPTRTIYKNIYTLPPAHRLIYVNGKLNVEPYWKLPAINGSISADEASERLMDLLDTSVAEQLIADVPTGAFLSGGLDSSTIVALASRHTKKLKTYSFRFNDERDETPIARTIAKRYGTDHTELSPEKHGLVELLRTMQTVYDEPFADSSAIPTYLLSEAARKHVTVALTGDGGDELFGGYTSWYRPLLAMQNEKNANVVRVGMLYIAARLARRSGVPGGGRDAFLNRYLGARFRQKFASLREAHENQDVAFSDSELANIVPHGSWIPTRFEHDTSETLDDIMRDDVQNYMPGDILVKIDRASMAHGLELRAPFLGKEFAEFALSLPYQLKINSEGDKQIFRKAFSELWTDEVKAHKKTGFGAPVSEWLADPAVEELLKSLLDTPKSKLFELVSFEKTRPYVRARDARAWTLLNLALWAETHDYDLD